ncbi:O-methyltransferase [Mycobacterium phage Suarez]|nr:O-methyltransferase [Mycobacterium phage Suarez]
MTTVSGDLGYALGPRFVTTGDHYALLRYVASLWPEGLALEFGVGKGESTRILAENMAVIGFDSFEGLPEDWRPEFPKGSFRFDMPDIPEASFHVGWFEDTLPEAMSELERWPIGLVHIDCDLYSSTKTVLDHIGHLLTPGVYIVFDEWHSYEGCEQHEQRAWREFAERTGISWRVVGHGFEQWAIQITERESNV